MNIRTKLLESEILECGLCIGEGWYDLLIPIIVYSELYGCTIGTVKEKFGALRVYSNKSDEVLEKLIDWAEEMSQHVCENCGTMKNVTCAPIGSWYLTLCEECRDDVRSNFNSTKNSL